MVSKEKLNSVLNKINSLDEICEEFLDNNNSPKPLTNLYYKSEIIVFGQGNNGKTSLLYLLLIKLSKGQLYEKAILDIVKNNIITKKSPFGNKYSLKDLRIIIPYNNHLIYISTIGDGRIECEENLFFFQNRLYADKIGGYTLRNCMPIIIVNDSGNYTSRVFERGDIKDTVNKYSSNLIFVCPCRTDGGAFDATEYGNEELTRNLLHTIWIRKCESDNLDNVKLFTKEDNRCSDVIKTIIDKTTK